MKQKTKISFLSALFIFCFAGVSFASTSGKAIDSSIGFFNIVAQTCIAIEYIAPAVGLLCFAGGVFQLATHGAEGNRLMATLFWGAAGCGILWGGSTKMLKWMMGNASEGALIDEVCKDVSLSVSSVPQINVLALFCVLYAIVSIGAYLQEKQRLTLKFESC